MRQLRGYDPQFPVICRALIDPLLLLCVVRCCVALVRLVGFAVQGVSLGWETGTMRTCRQQTGAMPGSQIRHFDLSDACRPFLGSCVVWQLQPFARGSGRTVAAAIVSTTTMLFSVLPPVDDEPYVA